MSSRQLKFVMATVLALGLGVFAGGALRPGARVSPQDEAPVAVSSLAPVIEASPEAAPRATPSPSISAGDGSVPAPQARFPRQEDYVREARQQGGGKIPPSMVAFARALAPRLEAALASAEEAGHWFGELEGCARDASAPSSVRSVCAMNAARLVSRHPGAADLRDRFEALKAGLPAELSRALEAQAEMDRGDSR